MDKEVLLKVRDMNKHFGSTIALNHVDIDIRRGEILGLIGENGSGKSTVTSIIAGMQKADSGKMEYQGKIWEPTSMLDALEQKIGMIVQECGTVPGVSVAENIFLGEVQRFKKFGLIQKKIMEKEAQDILDSIGAGDMKASMLTGQLDMQSRKLVEIAKVMHKNPEILVVDETTTALSQKGRDIIYDIMNRMKQENKAVVFISHDLEEIMKVCDALTVLRDGNIIVTFQKDEFDEEKIKTSMIGRQLQGNYYRNDWDGSYEEKVVLEIQNGQLGTQLKNMDLQLHKGEILGIGGLSDCGMHTLGKVLFGAQKLENGKVLVDGNLLRNEADAMKYNVGYVSKDRDYESLVLNASIEDNISAGGLDKYPKKGLFVLPQDEKAYVEKQITELSIKCQNRQQYVSALSGGNKQKVVFGKWIGRGSEILILDCPTRGVDIGVKQAMYQLMYQMKKVGKSIVIISEEMSELIGMSDRILIMKDGEVTSQIKRDDKPEEADIIRYMI